MFIYMFVRMAQSVQDRNLNACYNQLLHGETGVDSGQTLNADELPDACGLNCPLPLLKAKQALNAMESGHRTMPHHHDENDELLSAVYYIRVPENSGDLILHDDGKKVCIQPQEGKLVMFAPRVLHEVTVNLGKEMRLSVAMNVGPAGD